MDINNLNAFIQVAEAGSFSEAANRLHITQPAVSKRISALEEQLGTRLIDRIGRKVELTPAGATLLPRAKSIIRDLEDMRRCLDNLSGDITGRLNLAISHHLGLHRLPPILQAFTQRYPKVTLDIQFLDSEVAYEAVAQGEIELAVITLTEQVSEKIHVQTIWRDPLAFVASTNHPLAQVHKVTLDTLSQHGAILPELNTFTGTITKRLFNEQKLPLNTTMTTNYLETIRMMVSLGLGWSVLPLTLMNEQLCELKVGNIRLERQLGAIHHTERTLSNAALAMLALLKQAS
jgi:DNA-binding transcriptional LysR family regulator